MLVASAISHGAYVPVPASNSSTGEGYLTIETYNFQSVSGTIALVVRFKPDGWVNTGCSASDTNKIMTYWNTSTGPFFQILHASVIAAMAQGQKVRVGYDNAVCDASYGRQLYGISPGPIPE
ncbi:MAG TPA: hypothetical protein DF427_08185 [Moraxellaceae bacterium]|nr:hypothetical protein [Moraxellaceae bacterium]